MGVRAEECELEIKSAYDTAPAIVNSNTRSIDRANSFAIRQVDTEVGHIIHIAHGRIDRIVPGLHFLVAFHVNACLEGIADTRIHSAHHHSIASDAFATIVRSGTLGQTDQPMLARGISST